MICLKVFGGSDYCNPVQQNLLPRQIKNTITIHDFFVSNLEKFIRPSTSMV